MNEDDAISRHAAIEKIHWLGLDNDTAIKCDLAIRALSPVNTQEPKTGHWIWENVDRYWVCSECERINKDDRSAYCKYCGAKMVEPQESGVHDR